MHEAGHAVLARVFDHELGIVSIVPHNGTLGRSVSEDWDSFQRVKFADGEWVPDKEEMERDVCVHFAGYAAELYLEPDCKREARQVSCTDDKMAAEIMAHLGVADEQPFRERTMALVREHSSSILLVAFELDFWRTLDQVEVDTCMDLAKQGQPCHISALARYRALSSRIMDTAKACTQECRRLTAIVNEVSRLIG